MHQGTIFWAAILLSPSDRRVIEALKLASIFCESFVTDFFKKSYGGEVFLKLTAITHGDAKFYQSFRNISLLFGVFLSNRVVQAFSFH